MTTQKGSRMAKPDALAVRSPVLEGEVVDVELTRLVEQHGVMGAIQHRMWRRCNDKMMREFLNPQMFVPGANPDLLTIDIDTATCDSKAQRPASSSRRPNASHKAG